MFKQLFKRLCVFLLAVISITGWAEDLKIGAIFPLSGASSSNGDVFISGAQLAVEHINKDQLLEGRLSIVYEDSQALPQKAVIAMNKLVNVDRVPFVMCTLTGVSKAIAPIAQRMKTVVVNGAGVSPDLSRLGEYFWNVTPLVNNEVKAIVPYLLREKNLKRIALVYIDDPFGQVIRKELSETLAREGGRLVSAISVSISAQQFSGIAAIIRQSHPDAIYIASYGAQQIAIVKQLRDNGINQQLISYAAFAMPEIKVLPEAEGAIYTSSYINYSSDDRITRRFVDDYVGKYGKKPPVHAVNYYNAVMLYGILASNLEKKKLSITGENLLNERLRGRKFALVGGNVEFDESGVIKSAVQINQIEAGGNEKIISISGVK